MDPNTKKKRKTKKKKTEDSDYEYEYTDLPGGSPIPPRYPQAPPPQPPPQQRPPLPQMRPNPPPQQPIRMGGSDAGGGLVMLPKAVELQMPGGPQISKQEKRKKRAKAGQIKVFQDAANSCVIEVDDDGNLLSVMMSDDLGGTYLKFGKEQYGVMPAINYQEGPIVPVTPKKKPWHKEEPRVVKYGGSHIYYSPWETINTMSSDNRYKKIRVKKQKLKTKKAKVELLFAADKADLIVEEYTDKVGKIYVAFPDKRKHLTYLFALPERLNVITEEFSKDIPIRRANDDKANWYVQDTSSEESEEEPTAPAPQMCETSINVDQEYEETGVRTSVGFRGSVPTSMQGWRTSGPAPPPKRLLLT